MLLAVDIGNSNVVIGGWKGERWNPLWRLATQRTEDALLFYESSIQDLLLENGLRPNHISSMVLSSVVPELTPVMGRLLTSLFNRQPLLVDNTLLPRLQIQVDNPNEIGADLLANAVAAYHTYRRDLIIVDFGTALTFTTVNSKGKVLGVSIAPGLKTAMQSLFANTAQLPEVPLEVPSSALGRNTQHAIQSGVLLGYIGLVRHLLNEIKREAGPGFSAIATGGLVQVLHPLHEAFLDIAPTLTLDGLRLIHQQLAS